MPTFDVVSEVDAQEVRNAVDQAQREIANRFDFKNTNSTIEQNDMVITLHTVSRDRLDALRTVLEEKLVKRSVSLKGVDYGDVQDATQNTVRQVVTIKVGNLLRQGQGGQQAHQGEGPEGRVEPDPGRVDPGDGEEARRPPGRHCDTQGRGSRDPAAVPELPRLISPRA